MKTPNVGIPDHIAEPLTMAEQHDWLQRNRPSRRSILRGGALGLGALVAAPTLLNGSPAGAATLLTRAATAGPTLLRTRSPADGARLVPFGRHLAFGADPRHQIRFGWQVPSPVSKPFVRLGRHPENLGKRVDAEIRALHTGASSSRGTVDQYYVHAGLDHLESGTTYYYVVGHDGFDPRQEDLIGVSSFSTAPERDCPPFTFTAFGDQGVSYDALGNNNGVLGQDPVFHLLAGDICYADSVGLGLPTDVYDPRTWDSYFVQNEQLSARVPTMVATGNHDMEALYSHDGYGGQVKRFDFPGNGPGHCPSVYSFVYGNVAVISLDANDVSNEIPANRGYSEGVQTKWLRHQLRSLRTQPDVDFIVVFFHHCAYSTTSAHASEGGVRSEWVPLFDQYRVDLVVNGHNHIFERTDPIRGGSPTKAAPTGSTVHPATDGTTYVAVGAGGRSLYSFPAPDSYEGHESSVHSIATYSWGADGTRSPETVGWSRVRYTGFAYLAVTATPARPGYTTTLKVRGLSENGTELDVITLHRRARQVDRATRGVEQQAGV